MRVWERQKNESNTSYECFQFWLELGDDRALKEVSEKFNLRITRVRAWAKKWDWNGRLKAWLDFLLAIQQKAIANKLKDAAESWADRRIFTSDKGYELGKKLIEKAEMMLQFDPIEKIVHRTERVIKDGEEVELPVVIEYRPSKWGWRDPQALTEIGIKLMRLSAEMATSHEAVSVNVTNNNLEQARFMLERLQNEWMEKFKDLPPEIDRAAMMKKLPAMAAKAWNVTVEELIPVEEQPAIEGELISAEPAEIAA